MLRNKRLKLKSCIKHYTLDQDKVVTPSETVKNTMARLEKMFELLIVLGNEFFCANDAGIGKIAGAVGKSIDLAQFKIPAALLGECFLVDLNSLFRLLGTFFI